MRRKTRKIIIFCAILFLMSVFYFKINPQVLQVETIEAKFIYSKSSGAGFDVSPGKLTFGMFSDGGSASRGITVENLFDEKVLVNIKSEGNIADYLIVSENNFFLEPGESRDLNFVVYAPDNENYGEYVGTVTISLKD